MNPITKALSDIKFKIPKPILEEAFIRRKGYDKIGLRTPVSLDYRIREEVIDARVMPDVNLVGGQETTIPLRTIVPEYLADYKTVFRIPLTLTQNRKISKVLSLVFGDGGVPTNANMYTLGSSSYEDAASGLLASHLPIPNVSNHNIQLIGENTVLVHSNITPSPQMYLRCVLEADSEFSHLRTASIPIFSKLVEYAVKSYIYNTLIISIDEAYLTGGQALGKFQAIVEEYADAEELYQEYFKTIWRKTALFSDEESLKRHIRLVTGGRH